MRSRIKMRSCIKMSYKKSIGARGEEIAAEYLGKMGYRIIAQNLRVSHDEIDIVAEDEAKTVFVEVKSRADTPSNRRFGRPASAVDYAKQQRLIRAAKEYMRRNPGAKPPRIDVIEVVFPAIHEDTPINISRLLPLRVNYIRNAVHK